MTIASAIDDVIIAQGGTPDPTDTIEESIRNLGQYIGGGNTATYTFSIWNIDSSGNMATDGDYAVARASLADGRPIVPIVCEWNFDQASPYFTDPAFLSPKLAENSIKLYYSETEGLEWDADGITAFIDQ